VPTVVLHKDGEILRGEVPMKSNLVVLTGVRKFPYPNFKYRCGMGKCATCASRILSGGEHLPAPNWKEKKMLGEWLDRGYRLACQLWIEHDIELVQDVNLADGRALAPSAADKAS
jgi:ferredoxin